MNQQSAQLRILLISHYFAPEVFRINQVAADLAHAGMQLTVLTGQPNYPSGQIFEGYSATSMGLEAADGYNIMRVPIIPRGNAGGLRLILNYLSFLVSAIVFGTWLLRRRRFDVVFVYCTTPVTQGFAGLWFGLIKRARVVQWVQDLWPEALAATGFVRVRILLDALRRLVRLMYRRSDLILGQSHAFVRHLSQQAGKTPVAYFPNPGESPSSDASPPVMELGEGFHVLFAGNLGKAQALSTVIAAAEMLREDTDIIIWLFGSGSMLPWLATETAARGLSNVRLGGRMPPEAMPGLYAQAGALLLTLVNDPLLAQTVPSKLQSYMAAGKPIIAAVNGEASDIVRNSGAGLACPAEDPTALAITIREMKSVPADTRRRMAEAACLFFDEHYKPDRLINHLVALLSGDALRTASMGQNA